MMWIEQTFHSIFIQPQKAIQVTWSDNVTHHDCYGISDRVINVNFTLIVVALFTILAANQQHKT